MTVSVIIPTYNRNGLLFGRALPSILRQSRPVAEILIVADGMEGKQLAELEHNVRHLQFETDITLRLWNIDRQEYPDAPEWSRWGLYAVKARNHGIDKARGDWLMLLDDDDELEDRAIEILLDAASDDHDFVYGKSMTYKNERPIGQLYGSFPPGDGTVTHGAFLMRSGMPYRYAIDAYDRGRNADADLWIRMYDGGVRFHFVDQVVHRYHRNWP